MLVQLHISNRHAQQQITTRTYHHEAESVSILGTLIDRSSACDCKCTARHCMVCIIACAHTRHSTSGRQSHVLILDNHTPQVNAAAITASTIAALKQTMRQPSFLIKNHDQRYYCLVSADFTCAHSCRCYSCKASTTTPRVLITQTPQTTPSSPT
jgi:hypothetical protein